MPVNWKGQIKQIFGGFIFVAFSAFLFALSLGLEFSGIFKEVDTVLMLGGIGSFIIGLYLIRKAV